MGYSLNAVGGLRSALMAMIAPSGPAPFILYTDIVAGSTTNGENGNGSYLRIYGGNFGTTGLGSTTTVKIGGQPVAAHLELGQSIVYGISGIQRITVQVGSLGGATAGSVNNVQVFVNGVGSNTDKTFTVQVGNFYFVDNVVGSDTTGVVNDITHPYRDLQFWTGSAFTGIWASGKLQAGDTIVLRAGTFVDNTGYDGRWMRMHTHSGNAATGVAAHGWIHVTAYPNETVQFNDPAGGGGGPQGCGTSDATAGHGKYVSISCLHMQLNATTVGDGAGVNLQSSADFWRVIDNELGPWPSTVTGSNSPKSGAISGDGHNMTILGNYCHDIDGDHSLLENHLMYFDGSNSCTQNTEVAYNWCFNALSGSGIQWFNSVAADLMTGNLCHHNFIDTVAKYGANIADGTDSINFYNNIIINSQGYGIRYNGQTAPTAVYILYNTLYNCMRSATSYTDNAVYANDASGTANLKVIGNIIMLGPNTRTGCDYMALNGETTNKNLCFDSRGVNTTPDGTNGIYGNPLFVSASTGNFNIGSASPASNAQSGTVPITVSNDFYFQTRPFPGKTNPAIGAIEPTA